MRFYDLNWEQVEAYLQRDDRVVLPVGSTEQHAYLSLRTDSEGFRGFLVVNGHGGNAPVAEPLAGWAAAREKARLRFHSRRSPTPRRYASSTRQPSGRRSSTAPTAARTQSRTRTRSESGQRASRKSGS